MSAAWPTVALGDLLRRSEHIIPLDPEATYKEVTVRINGKGVVERRQVQGVEIAANRRYQAKSGQFIISRIDARHGASGLIPDELDGAVVTNDFPLFDVAEDRLDAAFLGWMSKTASFVELCKRASEGTTNRVRLSEDRFKALSIPLPPLDEQRRIVARIEELAAKVKEARGLRAAAIEEVEAHWPAILRLAFDGKLVSLVPFKASAQEILKQAATFHANYQETKNNNAYPNKPQISDNGPYALPTGWCWTTLGSVLTHMVDCVNDTPNFSEVDTGLLGLKTTNIRPYRLDLQRRWYMTPGDFASWNRRQPPQAGDIVLTREAPVGNVCMLPEGISACLTQRLMLLRAENRVIQSRYLLHFLNSPCFTDQIAASGRGQTHPHIRVGDAPHFLLPLPPMEQQVKIVAELDALQSKLDSVKALQTETAAELDAMLPAILDKAFTGEL
ncbi:restriction endonuclease S subunit [Nitrobacter winogradskyi Nb-255]|uniref:Restriction endonuclease S subunit n=1 Tax=Nitrobacter winogradskyi (strain ATCC 25391 / DSM 10237 / CIP 104748 / NCIMB 11846 / Nb-255) TaxID=323098 RepID=Q3SW06_NITWN|nr:restriction endonuclease subunit S [Nitrobacter winogradskyi]ABA03535.1 restriction endonuclease S subunit [Nitrobacter winogradskyi Nb-255]